jgi:trimeric autotransporter adhesin
VQAVVPPPDGGYPNFTTAEGQNALFSLTTGAANTAVGWFSLKSVTTGSFNTGVGAGTLVLNTGEENTAIGTAALLLNTASGNTAVGSRALLNNTTGGTLGNVQGFDVGPNVAVGQQALESNTIASANTAMGYQALYSFTTGPLGFEQLGLCTAVGFQALANTNGDGFGNSGFGYQALMNNTDGIGNTAVGFFALTSNTDSGNTAIGSAALFGNTTGFNNTATGQSALFSNTAGFQNTADGVSALANNIDGDFNTAIGFTALENNTTGNENTASGTRSLNSNIEGGGNTAIGVDALASNTTGQTNVAVGHSAGTSITTANDVICIGASVTGENVSNSCYIGNIFGVTSTGGTGVFVNANGKLGTTTSSLRFKEKIESMEEASQVLHALKPVTFRYKKEIDPAGTAQFGLVAEDVEKVNPDLVVRDKEGKPYSVRYDQVNAMLLNEFLKEHKTVEQQQSKLEREEATIAELKSTVAQQQKGMEALAAQLQDQAIQIRRVSTQIGLSKPALQTVANDD